MKRILQHTVLFLLAALRLFGQSGNASPAATLMGSDWLIGVVPANTVSIPLTLNVDPSPNGGDLIDLTISDPNILQDPKFNSIGPVYTYSHTMMNNSVVGFLVLQTIKQQQKYIK